MFWMIVGVCATVVCLCVGILIGLSLKGNSTDDNESNKAHRSEPLSVSERLHFELEWLETATELFSELLPVSALEWKHRAKFEDGEKRYDVCGPAIALFATIYGAEQHVLSVGIDLSDSSTNSWIWVNEEVADHAPYLEENPFVTHFTNKQPLRVSVEIVNALELREEERNNSKARDWKNLPAS